MVFALVSLLSHAARAQAPVEANACLAAFDAAQNHRKAGELVDADAQLVTCGQAHCPLIVRSKCIEWREQVAQDVPSIVVTVRDAAGNDTSAARVFVNGELVREQLDGQPIRLDPGRHELRVEHGAEPPHTEPLVLAAGQQNREVMVSFAVESRPKEDGEGKGLSPLVYVGASLAGAGLILGAITGGLALSKGAELDDACPDKAQCDASAREVYDDGLTLSHVSTVSLAIAGAGAALGIVGLLLSDWSGGDVELSIGPLGVGMRGSF